MERSRIDGTLYCDTFDAATVVRIRSLSGSQLLLPLLFQQIVSLEQRLEHVVVLRVAAVQELLLDASQLELVDSEQTTLSLSKARLSAHRLRLIKENLLTYGPADGAPAKHVLRLG